MKTIRVRNVNARSPPRGIGMSSRYSKRYFITTCHRTAGVGSVRETNGVEKIYAPPLTLTERLTSVTSYPNLNPIYIIGIPFALLR